MYIMIILCRPCLKQGALDLDLCWGDLEFHGQRSRYIKLSVSVIFPYKKNYSQNFPA